MCRRIGVWVFVVVAAGLNSGERARAQVGPDLIVGIINECKQLGREGAVGAGTIGMACNSTACNKGDESVDWYQLPDTDHPVIEINMYRLATVDGADRFEQIGYSWLKHGFGSANADECGFGCTPPPDWQQDGPGCSDTYAAEQFFPCVLGARSALNPYTGAIPGGDGFRGEADCDMYPGFPSMNHQGHVHTGISHRVQIKDTDLIPLLNPGARYFAEVTYIVPHEYTAGTSNQFNNASYCEQTVSGPDVDGLFTFTDAASTVSESPAIHAWPGATRTTLEPAPSVDGRGFLVHEVTDLGGGMWHYEYALYNVNLDRSMWMLRLPLPSDVVLSNVEFYAPPPQAPELHAENYSGEPWSVEITPSHITFSTDTYWVDPLANAVRYGMLYNFRFDADAPPRPVSGTVGFFKTGGAMSAATEAPAPQGVQDCNGNGIDDVCDLDCSASGCSVAGCGQSGDCDADGLPDECEIDCTGNGIPDDCEPDSNGNGLADTCDCVTWTSPLVSPTDVATSRYLSIVPTTAGRETALRVTLTDAVGFSEANGRVLWVGPPKAYPDEDTSDPGKTFIAAALQCEPFLYDWGTVGLVRVYGGEIMPGSTYDVHTVDVTCLPVIGTGFDFGAALNTPTGRWGDVTPLWDGDDPGAPQPDFNDLAALVAKFLATPGAPIKARAQLQPNVVIPERAIDFRDISAGVSAFIGTPYTDMSGITGPCPCPSIVTCGATACQNDLACGAGYCVDGFCADACGRCSP